MKWEGVRFVRVDSDIADNLIDKQENNHVLLTEEQSTQLKDDFKRLFQNPKILLATCSWKPFTKARVIIMAIILTAVAATDSRMINLEKLCCLLKAMRLAIW